MTAYRRLLSYLRDRQRTPPARSLMNRAWSAICSQASAIPSHAAATPASGGTFAGSWVGEASVLLASFTSSLATSTSADCARSSITPPSPAFSRSIYGGQGGRVTFSPDHLGASPTGNYTLRTRYKSAPREGRAALAFEGRAR